MMIIVIIILLLFIIIILILIMIIIILIIITLLTKKHVLFPPPTPRKLGSTPLSYLIRNAHDLANQKCATLPLNQNTFRCSYCLSEEVINTPSPSLSLSLYKIDNPLTLKFLSKPPVLFDHSTSIFFFFFPIPNVLKIFPKPTLVNYNV